MSEQTCTCGRWKYIVFDDPRGYYEKDDGWREEVGNPDAHRSSLRRLPAGIAFCDRCGDRLNENGTVTHMVPVAPSAAVRGTLLYRALVGSDPRLEVIRGQLLGLDLLTYETTGWTPTDQGRTILSALEGNGQIALPEVARERDEARAAAVWLSKYCEEETDREYSRAHEEADTFLRDAYEATTGTVPNAQEITQE